MKTGNPKTIFIMICLFILLSACNFPRILTTQNGTGISAEDQSKTSVALTVAAIMGNPSPSAQETPMPPTQEPPTVATNTPEPTHTPTITLTATSEKAYASVSVDTNCRMGPAKIFDYIGALLVGEKAEVVGKSSEGDYWIIKNPDGAGTCWIWGYYTSVTGPTSGIALIAPPPTPTPLFAWDGTWTVWVGPVGGSLGSFTLTITTNQENFSGSMVTAGLVSLSGVMDQRHTLVNGTWTTTVPGSGGFKFVGIGSNQFNGYYDSSTDPSTQYAWCGARGGAAQPNPCYSP